MSGQHFAGALLFGRRQLCPSDQCCALSDNSWYLVLLHKQVAQGATPRTRAVGGK